MSIDEDFLAAAATENQNLGKKGLAMLGSKQKKKHFFTKYLRVINQNAT